MCLVGRHKKKIAYFLLALLLFFFLIPMNDVRVAASLRLATIPKRDRLGTEMKETNGEFIAFRDHFNVSLSISFSFWHCVSPFVFLSFSFCTRLFFNTTPFNCYYQIQLHACNTRKLWNFFFKPKPFVVALLANVPSIAFVFILLIRRKNVMYLIPFKYREMLRR